MVTSMHTDVRPVPAWLVGVAAWLPALALPVSLQERVLLVAPLVVVPALLARLPERLITGRRTTRDPGPWWALIAALPLLVAMALPRGPVAAGLVMPWVVVVVGLAIAGIRDALGGMPSVLRPGSAGRLATDAALGGLAVGAGSLLIDRSGVSVPPVSSVIMTLTAVHFHVAAFGLVAIAALAAARRPGVVAWLAIGSIVVGTAVTALGFLVVFAFQWVGAVMVGSGGLVVAALIARSLVGTTGPTLLVGGLAVVALAIGMVLAIAWPTSLVLAPGLLDIDLMVRTHGVLNATAVVVLALLPWDRVVSPDARRAAPVTGPRP
ncbi:MAG: YndJ family transporter [Chloroflexi bacterium]|nr:YndJ family transporter [Chloroflexota bacterium]